MEGSSSVLRYVDLARQQEGEHLEATLKKAVKDPELFVYGELLSLPSVQALTQSQAKKEMELLAYGNYFSYKDGDIVSEDKDRILYKLKQVTMMDIFTEEKQKSYDELIKLLDLQGDQELERLFVSAKSAGFLAGKLDQRRRRVYVDFADGRDVSTEKVDHLIYTFSTWLQKTDKIIDKLEKHRDEVDAKAAQELQDGIKAEQRKQEAKKKVAASSSHDYLLNCTGSHSRSSKKRTLNERSYA